MKKSIVFLMSAILLGFAACNNEKKEEADGKMKEGSTMETKEERNKKVIMASMESFMKNDIDGVFKDVASSFVDYADGTMPPMNNLDTLKAFIKMLTTTIEGYKGENLKYYTDGDYVLVHGDWGGTFNKDVMGIKATGKPLMFKDVDIFKLNEEGKVTEHHSIQNVAAVLMTAGAMK